MIQYPLYGRFNKEYAEEDFLKEVFIDEDEYNTLVSLLERKKNIIVQGSPGVGKTFAAKRFAYSMLGEKDKEKIKEIQLHQNYSYEDLVKGYRRNKMGDLFLKRVSSMNFVKKDINVDYKVSNKRIRIKTVDLNDEWQDIEV